MRERERERERKRERREIFHSYKDGFNEVMAVV